MDAWSEFWVITTPRKLAFSRFPKRVTTTTFALITWILRCLCHRRLKNPYVTALLICIISVSLIKIFFVNVEMTKAAAFNFLKRSWFADYLDKVRPKELKLKLPSCNS